MATTDDDGFSLMVEKGLHPAGCICTLVDKPNPPTDHARWETNPRCPLHGHHSYCFCHYRFEEIPAGGAFIICFECGHVYATAQDLVDAWNREVDRMNADPLPESKFEGPIPRRTLETVGEIFFCQECIHDF
jgi:hypothetical protein